MLMLSRLTFSCRHDALKLRIQFGIERCGLVILQNPLRAVLRPFARAVVLFFLDIVRATVEQRGHPQLAHVFLGVLLREEIAAGADGANGI